jgi:hypothetical protein
MFYKLTITAVLLLALCTSVFAGANYGTAKVAVHVEPHRSRTCTKDMPAITVYEDIIMTLDTPDADCFPVFFDLSEYQYVEYGLTWPGLYSCAFAHCCDVTTGFIINPGDGVTLGWLTCQPGPVAIAGWAWIYDYGSVCVVPHPVAGGPLVGDCSGMWDEVVANWCAEIGLICATEAGTWGEIKSLFK